MKKIIFLASVLLLSGCVTYGPSLQQRINLWIGSSESDLISRLGIPTKSYVADNGYLYMEYTASASGSTIRQGTNDSMYNLPGYCTQSYCPPRQSTVTNYNYWCTVTYVLNQQRVIVNGGYRLSLIHI